MISATQRMLMSDHDGNQHFISLEECARVDMIKYKTLTSESKVFINGDWLPVPPITWDGSQNEEVKMVFALLGACECCEKHEQNKPVAFQWTSTSSRKHLRSETGDNYVGCECDCRHRMRVIARQFN